MSVIPALSYPDSERDLLQRQARLFDDWTAHMAQTLVPFEDYSAEAFVYDGFYPHYLAQKVRVLFVGRESRGLSGCNYIEALHPCYRNGKPIGRLPLNRSKFHRLMLYAAYSLNHGFCGWDDTPWASDIGKTFAEPGGLSFAFMNLSKFSNERTSWQMIRELMACSISASQGTRHFIREHIELLAPHVVVTMNFPQHFALLGQLTELEQHDHAEAYRLQAGGHTALLLNTFHFSAPRKRDREHILDPISELAAKHLFLD